MLTLPSAPGPAPVLNTPPAELDLFRSRLLSLTCIAGLGGLPQVKDSAAQKLAACDTFVVFGLYWCACTQQGNYSMISSWFGGLLMMHVLCCTQGLLQQWVKYVRILQVSLPLVEIDGCPVGFSLIGPKGSDEKLLELTEKLMVLLKL